VSGSSIPVWGQSQYPSLIRSSAIVDTMLLLREKDVTHWIFADVDGMDTAKAIVKSFRFGFMVVLVCLCVCVLCYFESHTFVVGY